MSKDWDGWPNQGTWDMATVLANERAFYDVLQDKAKHTERNGFISKDWLVKQAYQYRRDVQDFNFVDWDAICNNLELENDLGWVLCDVCGREYQRSTQCPHRKKEAILCL